MPDQPTTFTAVEIPCGCKEGTLVEVRGGWECSTGAMCEDRTPDVDLLREYVDEAVADGHDDVAAAYAHVIHIQDGDSVDRLLSDAADKAGRD